MSIKLWGIVAAAAVGAVVVAKKVLDKKSEAEEEEVELIEVGNPQESDEVWPMIHKKVQRTSRIF